MVKQMDDILKSGKKDKAKQLFSKYQSVLMQVAKTGTISKRTAARKISRVSKKLSSK